MFASKMLVTVILILVNVFSPIHGKPFHDYMTRQEKEAIFRVQHDKVHTLKYEVVPLVAKFAHPKRSNVNERQDQNSESEKHSIYLETFGENFDLYLEENKNTLFGDRTPVIRPYVDSHGNIKYDKRSYDLIPQLKIRAYHDRNKRSAVTIDEDDNGRVNVNGHINEKFFIRSIPERLHKEVLSKHSNLSVPFTRLNKTGEIHHHIIIKRNIDNDKHVKFSSTSPTNSRSKDGQTGLFNWDAWRTKLWPFSRSNPIPPTDYKEFTAYPKILVVLDHATYLSHRKNMIECVRHSLAYWNAVDLRFREMEKPTIRLNIAGIIIATNPNVTPYLENQKASDTSRWDVQTLDELKSYFSEEDVTHVDYDIVVAFSPLELVDGDWKWFQWIKSLFTNIELDASVEGIAELASICEYPRTAMAIVKDGGFDTNVAAHEIGHILGAEHDPENLRNDDPDYKSDWEHGFIMSYLTINKNQMHWSDFSIFSMQQNLQRNESNHCLLKKPKVGTPYRKLLPGKIMSRDEQCKIQFGDWSYSDKNPKFLSDCLNSYCFSPENHTIMKTNIPVPEGSYCGKEKICIEGECVRDLTNAVVYQNL